MQIINEAKFETDGGQFTNGCYGIFSWGMQNYFFLVDGDTDYVMVWSESDIWPRRIDISCYSGSIRAFFIDMFDKRIEDLVVGRDSTDVSMSVTIDRDAKLIALP